MKTAVDPIDKKLHDQFSSYGLRAKEWMRKCVMLLPEIERRKIWQKKGFSSIYEYAAKIAGMSRNSVNEALRVFEKIADKPELQKIVEMRGINAVKPVVTIATRETSAFWAQKAEEMSKNTLETYVREVRGGRLSDEEKNVNILRSAELNVREQATDQDRLGDLPRKASLTIEVDTEIAEQLKKLKGQGSWDDLMKEFLELREEKLESEKPESVETTLRYIPAKIKKYSIKKTNGTCSFPGCTKPYKILHHTKRFALTNEHDPDTLQPLCKEHENLAHLGLIENEHKNSKSWMLLEKPDLNDPAYDIDLAVQRLRRKIRIQS